MWVESIKIALGRMGIRYKDTSKEYQIGHAPDIVTGNAFIEAKNWIGSVHGRYHVGIRKYESQIKSRFFYAGSKIKILIQLKGVRWTPLALEQARRDNIVIVSVPTTVTTTEDIIPASFLIEQQLRVNGVWRLLDNPQKRITNGSNSLYDISQSHFLYPQREIDCLLKGFDPPFEVKYADQLIEKDLEAWLSCWENLGPSISSSITFKRLCK
jgi:hypothetical protein